MDQSLDNAPRMRRTLLDHAVLDVVYYSNLVVRTTLFASGDCDTVPYLLLMHAVASDQPVTTRDLAQRADIAPTVVDAAAEHWEAEGLLLRTRSPRDRRIPAFVPTVVGNKHAQLLDELLGESLCDFWRMDRAGLDRLQRAVEPFQRLDVPWPTRDGLPVSLRFLCALHALWKQMQAFSHHNTLTLSEMHILLAIDAAGAIPNEALYPTRNHFATSDLHTARSLVTEKGLMELRDGMLDLTPHGRGKIAQLIEQCDPPTRNKADEEGPAATLVETCRAITRNATAN